MHRPLVPSVVLLAALALGTGPAAVDAGTHQVSGKGRLTSSVYLTRFEFSARGGPSQATGSMRFVVSFEGNVAPAQEGTVTCLKVRGDRMVIAGQLTAGPFAGTYFAVRAEDEGRDRRHPKDSIAWNYGQDAPIACADFDLGGDLDAHPLDRGDIEVR